MGIGAGNMHIHLGNEIENDEIRVAQHVILLATKVCQLGNFQAARSSDEHLGSTYA
jgi:hypothetical protein